jgi:anaerobic selenocysteine-containing dehydrogenase
MALPAWFRRRRELSQRGANCEEKRQFDQTTTSTQRPILCYPDVMNSLAKIDIRHSTCPHDCPSACALDIEVIDGSAIGRVRGSKRQSYTAGVVCAKVARYAERIHHPDRLKVPMRRTGAKGSGRFAPISWDEALDEIAQRFDAAEREFGAESAA